MTALTWDDIGQRFYETGVDHGVLYVPDEDGVYQPGVAWNGLTTVTESPSGAESSPQFADNIKYLNLVSAEDFGATIEAFTYPPEWAQCDGSAAPSVGVTLGQQGRKLFGFCYRTRFGNDNEGTDYGYKLHLVWGAQAAPSERAYASINDSPEAIAFSWAITTTPVPVTGYKPAASMTITSTEVDSENLAALEAILYGSEGIDPRLPLPDEIIEIFAGEITAVDLGEFASQPSYDDDTHVVTLPSVTGVTWTVNGEAATPGAQAALDVDETSVIKAHATTGYYITGDDTWVYNY